MQHGISYVPGVHYQSQFLPCFGLALHPGFKKIICHFENGNLPIPSIVIADSAQFIHSKKLMPMPFWIPNFGEILHFPNINHLSLYNKIRS